MRREVHQLSRGARNLMLWCHSYYLHIFKIITGFLGFFFLKHTNYLPDFYDYTNPLGYATTSLRRPRHADEVSRSLLLVD
jgi:hypothetical protein